MQGLKSSPKRNKNSGGNMTNMTWIGLLIVIVGYTMLYILYRSYQKEIGRAKNEMEFYKGRSKELDQKLLDVMVEKLQKDEELTDVRQKYEALNHLYNVLQGQHYTALENLRTSNAVVMEMMSK